VKPGDYYYKAVGIARKLEITNGTGNNKFNPKEPITRQDMIILTARAMKLTKKLDFTRSTTVLDTFTDAGSIAPYAVDAVSTMVKEGLIHGDGKRINPLSNTLRAEAAVLMYRIYNK